MSEAQSSRTPAERKLIKAGKKLFLKHGYGSVTTDMLVKEASSSKATLYKYFPQKSDILVCVLREEGDKFLVSLNVEAHDEASFFDALTSFGEGFLALLDRTDIQSLEQILIAESQSIPDVSAHFFASTYGRMRRNLTSFIQNGLDKAWVHSPFEPRHLAESLMSVWRGFQQDEIYFGAERSDYPSHEKRVKKALDLVFRRPV